MNRKLFLQQLRLHLRALPEEEIEDIISDYHHYFQEANSAGVLDEETIRQLGSPKEVAQELTRGRHENSNGHALNKGTSAILAVAVIFLNITFVLGPVIGIYGAVFGLVISMIACIASPVIVIIKYMMDNATLLDASVSLIAFGVGLLVLPLLLKLFQAMIQLTIKYIHWNMRIVKGEW